MNIIGLAGWSGSGKTTLVCQLLPLLTRRGMTVSTMKHAHHNFDVDKPGKDSHRHREAGATEVLVSSGRRWALMHELRDEPEADVDALVARMTPVDLLIIEGFKTHAHPKIEVHRTVLGKPLLAAEDPDIVAIAADTPTDAARSIDRAVSWLDLNHPPAIADFIMDHCRWPR